MTNHKHMAMFIERFGGYLNFATALSGTSYALTAWETDRGSNTPAVWEVTNGGLKMLTFRQDWADAEKLFDRKIGGEI